MMNTTQIAEKLAHDEDLLSRERKYLAAAIDAALTKAIAGERERIIEMADELEYELPSFEQMKGVETLRKKLQAAAIRRDDTADTEGEKQRGAG
jgi:hypothetical protein